VTFSGCSGRFTVAQSQVSVAQDRGRVGRSGDRPLSSVNAPEGAMLFGNLGSAQASPRFLRCPAPESSKGRPQVESGQSPVRLVWAESGQKAVTGGGAGLSHSGCRFKPIP